MKLWHKFFIAAALLVSICGCNSAQFTVADNDFYSDKFKLNDKYTQLVETQHDKSDSLPAVERFASNCVAAENSARARFKTLYPTSADAGRRIGEKFEKNAGCTVRMAFKAGQ